MKNIILLLFTIILFGSCSSKTVDNLFTHYKQDNEVVAATLPGWLVEKGLSMAFSSNTDEEGLAMFKNVIKDVDKLRVLVSTDAKPNPELKNLSQNLTKEKYELYGMVNHKDTKFNLWVKEKKKNVKDVFLFINSDDNVVLLHLKGEIDMDALQKINLNKTKTMSESKVSKGA